MAAAPGESPAANGASAQLHSKMRPATRLVHSETSMQDIYGASMPPLYQTATFKQPGATEAGEFDYTRSGNPTRTVLEELLADLEVRGPCWISSTA
jgi:cystathionine beta-lyase